MIGLITANTFYTFFIPRQLTTKVLCPIVSFIALVQFFVTSFFRSRKQDGHVFYQHCAGFSFLYFLQTSDLVLDTGTQ